MQTKLIRKAVPLFAMLFLASVCVADTFENVKTGEKFNGFATQKVKQGRTYVYSADESKFNAISLDDWRVTYSAEGRRNSVAVVALDSEEVLLSQAVSDAAAEAIIDSSNKGALAVLIEIDLPGGRGDYTKNLSDAIRNTTNCPVVAFIRSGDYGGAYSAATAVAFACDKIYISSSAVLGSHAPIRGSGGYYGQDFAEVFNSANLAAYKGYIATLAESNGRSGIMAMAMVDSQIDVVEVTSKDGKKSFINRENRIPSQTILRSWSSKMPSTGASDKNRTDMNIMLQPKDAVYTKIVDSVVDSRQDILDALGASDAKLLRKSGTIEKSTKKFIATRRNLDSLVANIFYLQDRTNELTERIRDIQKESTRTTERMVNDGYGPLYDLPFGKRSGRLQYDNYQSPNTRKRKRNVGIGRGVTVSETRPTVSANQLLDDLSSILSNLTRDYNRAIVLGRRFPGALPIGLTVAGLEKELYTANALYDDVAYRR